MEFFELFSTANWQSSLLIILNLILLESLLSVDNAAVLATMVMDLNPDDRRKALRYGILGAYLFRGLSLLLASVLISIWWLKPLGGLYLIYLSVSYFTKKLHEHRLNQQNQEENPEPKTKSKVYQFFFGKIGPLWSTVIFVEIMDMAFSIDNVFAAVAFTNHILLIYLGVFIGILAMRFVAQGFIHLMEKNPVLEKVAFGIIAILGIKLVLSGICHFGTDSTFCKVLESEKTDMLFSLITVIGFVLPILFGFIKDSQKQKSRFE